MTDIFSSRRDVGISLVDTDNENNGYVVDTEDGQGINGNMELLQVQEHLANIKELNEDAQEDIKQMPVTEYIKHFLKLHMGHTDENQRFNLNDWIDFAGGLYQPVELINPDGSVYATVPPMAPRGAYKLEGERESFSEAVQNNVSISGRLNEIDQMRNNYLPAAEQASTDLFASLVSNIDNKSVDDLKKEWLDFFSFMKVIPENQSTNQSTTPNQSTPQETKENIEFIVDYDDE